MSEKSVFQQAKEKKGAVTKTERLDEARRRALLNEADDGEVGDVAHAYLTAQSLYREAVTVLRFVIAGGVQPDEPGFVTDAADKLARLTQLKEALDRDLAELPTTLSDALLPIGMLAWEVVTTADGQAQ